MRCAATALYHAPFPRLRTALEGRLRRAAAFPVLAYHRVNDENDPFFPSLPSSVFQQHMAYLTRSYRVVTIEELVERMQRGCVPRNAIAITFDDGYRDNLTHAAPILARHGLPATIFLTTGLIGTSELAWFDQVAAAFKCTKAESMIAPWGSRVSLESQNDRLTALDRILAYLKTLTEDEFARRLDAVLNALGIDGQSGRQALMLDWDDVMALKGLGLSIGAHTVRHPILSRVSVARARSEIAGSRTMIESVCGVAPKAFAYPNGKQGDYDDTVQRLVREAGFACAVTSRFGLNTRRTPVYELRRGGPWEHDTATFALKLSVFRVQAR
jgi:peptidoglycan/xylan/chitin deacetylase (PgdA/CDA1 family)